MTWVRTYTYIQMFFLFRRITLFFHAHGGRSNLAALRQYTISAELGRIPPRQAVSVSVSVHYYAKITENQVTKSRIIKKKLIPSKIINFNNFNQ